MGRLFVPSQTLTPLDRIREALARAESGLSSIRGSGSQALQLLHLCDQISHELDDLDHAQVDVRAERTRFELVQKRLRRSQREILHEVNALLAPAREQLQPRQSQWWWYLDEAVVRQRRRGLARGGVIAAAAVALIAMAALAYQRFLAPPPEIGQAFRRLESGRGLVEAGDTRAALEDFVAAADLNPDDPEPWLWQGVMYAVLGETDRAEDAFRTAKALYGTVLEFHLSRGWAYLEAGQAEKAELDAERAMAEDPESGWVYYLCAAISVDRGDYEAALQDLDQAAGLANAAGDTQLEALARTQRAQVLTMVPLSDPTS